MLSIRRIIKKIVNRATSTARLQIPSKKQVPLDGEEKDEADILLADRIYTCPPVGNTETSIDISLTPIIGTEVLSRTYFENYYIRDYGKGISAVSRGIKEAAEQKFNIRMPAGFDKAWSRLVVVKCRCKMRDRQTGKPFSELRPRRVSDVLKSVPPSRGRAREIRSYAKGGVRNWNNPVYLSAGALGEMGITVAPGTCRMLDGARRMVAFALLHKAEVEVDMVMSSAEYRNLTPYGY